MKVGIMLAAALLGSAVFAASAPAAVVFGPTSVSVLTRVAGGARFRSLATSPSQQEIFLGRNDLGVSANRVGQNVTWIQNGANRFTFAYDASVDTLRASVNGGSVLNYTNFVGGLSTNVTSLPFNAIQLEIRDNTVGSGLISISNLTLNGDALTPFMLSGVDGSRRLWQIGGDFRQSFTLSGDINLSGAFGSSSDANVVEVMIGHAVPEPAPWLMMIGGFGALGAAIRRRRSGLAVVIS